MLFIELDREHTRSFTKQIYRQLQKQILCGELKYGERLPSTRDLSRELHVSRNTILTAYDMLVSEGFANSVPGSGIYVSQSAASLPLCETSVADYSVASLSTDAVPPYAISFDSGIPSLDLFPRSRWNRIITSTFREAPVSVLGYDDPQGRPELRSVLASYLKKTRGVNCDPGQIIITAGAKQGLTLFILSLWKIMQ
ncbi:GntR family transcriptional regulator [Lachnospiraceae bacterium 54-53]